MHELNPADAQRVDDRRPLYVGLLRDEPMRAPPSDSEWPPAPRRTACTANRCNSGDRKCPCPTACELPENTVVGRVMDVLDRVPVRPFWIGYAAFLIAFAAGLHFAFN